MTLLEIIPDSSPKSYLWDMQSPELDWLNNPVINQSEIARRLGISTTLFANKVRNNQYKKFNEDEMQKLETIRQQIIQELASTNPPA